MPRRRIEALCLATVLATPELAATQWPAPRPNIILIALDDMNDWVGPLGGHPLVKTPNLDRLAQRGTVFRNAHCQAPLCNPSRTSLLLGRRPSTTGIYALGPWFRDVPPLKELVTLPQHFARNGYRTLTCGKIWHDAYPPTVGRADGTEFDVWGPHGGFTPRPEKKLVSTPDDMPLMDWGPFPDRDEDTFDWNLSEWAVAQVLNASADRPFFLSVGLRHPHVPLYAPQRWFDLYPTDDSVLPPIKPGDRDDTPRFSWYLHWTLPEPRWSWLQESGQARPLARAYLASVSFADHLIGRVLDALEASGLADRTVVVVWGDNGWHLGEKAISGKNSLWDRSTRVPLMFAGPGIERGGQCPQPVELLDIFPTLVELCGLPQAPDQEGHSLSPQLRDSRAPRPWPAITTHGPGNHAVRTDRWRYIRYVDGSEELYDMQADPNEWTNLAADKAHAETKRELARWLPKADAPAAAGSTVRLIELRDGVPHWEGKAIRPDDPIPD